MSHAHPQWRRTVAGGFCHQLSTGKEFTELTIKAAESNKRNQFPTPTTHARAGPHFLHWKWLLPRHTEELLCLAQARDAHKLVQGSLGLVYPECCTSVTNGAVLTGLANAALLGAGGTGPVRAACPGIYAETSSSVTSLPAGLWQVALLLVTCCSVCSSIDPLAPRSRTAPPHR